jgi:DUF971 family protein
MPQAGVGVKVMEPLEIRLLAEKRALLVRWADGEMTLAAELLRVESPSAEVKGHGVGQAMLVSGKEQVTITGVEAVGNYAVQLHFSDGHRTGIYTWTYLRELGTHQASRWAAYEADLAAAGLSRSVPHAPVRRAQKGV